MFVAVVVQLSLLSAEGSGKVNATRLRSLLTSQHTFIKHRTYDSRTWRAWTQESQEMYVLHEGSKSRDWRRRKTKGRGRQKEGKGG